MSERGSRYAWITLVLLGVVLVVFGVYALMVTIESGRFEAQTGQVWAEFSTANPEVAAYLERERRLLGILTVAFGLFTTVLAWYGMRRGIGLAVRAMWIVPAVMAAVAIVFVVGDRPELGVTYAVVTVLAALAIVRAQRASG